MWILQLFKSRHVEWVIFGDARNMKRLLSVILETNSVQMNPLPTVTMEQVQVFIGRLVVVSCDNAPLVVGDCCVLNGKIRPWPRTVKGPWGVK